MAVSVVAGLTLLAGLFAYKYFAPVSNKAQAPTAAITPPPTMVGKPRPPFTMVDVEGKPQNVDQWNGKVVLINFWASWCKPCEQEAADLRASWANYKDGGQVVFLGVDYVDTEPEARAYLQKFGITYPNGPDVGTRISQAFRIKGVPETYFVDQTGTLRYVQIGPFTSVDQIKSIIDPLLE